MCTIKFLWVGRGGGGEFPKQIPEEGGDLEKHFSLAGVKLGLER